MTESELQQKLQFIKEYYQARNAATGSKYDSNANVTQKNLATLQCELGKKDIIEVRREIMRLYLTKLYGAPVSDQYFDDLKHHFIYQNDETTLYVYCSALSIYPFLLDGLKPLGGSSAAPKHANSFIGGLINLIFMGASQFAGAIAIPEFFGVFDYFLRKDYGQDYVDHWDEVIDSWGSRKSTLKDKIHDWFQQFVHSINQPAGARNYQSPFVNVAYFDRNYFENIFKDYFFPDGEEPCWETTKELQKLFMKWFNKERTHEVLTFPVETANLLVKDGEYADEETADFMAEMWSEGHSFFMYQSDSVDALASCCFSKDQKVIARSVNHGISRVYFDTFENLGNTADGPDRQKFEIFHNGSWCRGSKVRLGNRPMYKIVTANNKEIIVSDNHLHPTIRGNIATDQLTSDDYLLFNVRPLSPCPGQDLHLTYEQGFAVGAFLGDGSFGAEVNGQIYDILYSQNVDKYAKCIDMVNKANAQLGGEGSCRLNEVYNNVYPVRLSSKPLVDFITKWTCWERGTYSYNKKLNMECLLQSIEFRRGILDGWYNTDGGNSNRCYTTSKDLCECMEALITSLGMNSIINVSDRTDEPVVIRGQEYKRRYPLYCVRWYDMKNKRTMQDVYKVINNCVYFKIKSVEPVEYDGDIYCFEMENAEEPYFTLPNGLITHNCRLRNELQDNVFSYTLGAGGVKTGSKCVITLNLNRIVQDWYRNASAEERKEGVAPRIREMILKVHKYLNAWNEKLWDDFREGMLPMYTQGFIDLDKQYVTCGVNGFVEAGEFLAAQTDTKYNGLEISYTSEAYKALAEDILGTIKEENKKARTEHFMVNTECVPAENLAAKFYNWDKRDGYMVPESRVLYNSYFYRVEDPTVDPVAKFYYQGKGFATECDGGVALHNNLSEHLTKEQYRKLMDVAVDAGCNYWTYNIPNTICNECGHIDKHMLDRCPKCGSTNLDYATRIIGYLKRISNFSAVRQAEAKMRHYGRLDQEDFDHEVAQDYCE